jgi:polysaccharide biosynthesis protein PslL
VDILPQNVELAIVILGEQWGTLAIVFHKVDRMKARIEWIDVFRGLGILAVVIGHCFAGLTNAIIYTFHMPLFFIMGGLLYRPSTDYKGFFKHKAIHLLVPYLSFLCVIYAEPIVRSVLYILQKPSFGAVKGLLTVMFQGIYGGELLNDGTSAFWFVTCFFATQQIFNYLSTKFSPKKLTAILAVCLAASYIDSYYLQSWVFPGAINVTLAALPYFGLGVYLQKHNLKTWLYILSGVIFAGAIYLLIQGYPLNLNMKFTNYGVPVVSFLVASAAVVLLMGLSQLLTSLKQVKQPLIYLGSASMVILYVHQFVQMQVKVRLGEDANWWRFAASLLVSLVVYQILVQFSMTRALFLGSGKDFQMVFVRQPETSAS